MRLYKGRVHHAQNEEEELSVETILLERKPSIGSFSRKKKSSIVRSDSGRIQIKIREDTSQNNDNNNNNNSKQQEENNPMLRDVSNKSFPLLSRQWDANEATTTARPTTRRTAPAATTNGGVSRRGKGGGGGGGGGANSSVLFPVVGKLLCYNSAYSSTRSLADESHQPPPPPSLSGNQRQQPPPLSSSFPANSNTGPVSAAAPQNVAQLWLDMAIAHPGSENTACLHSTPTTTTNTSNLCTAKSCSQTRLGKFSPNDFPTSRTVPSASGIIYERPRSQALWERPRGFTTILPIHEPSHRTIITGPTTTSSHYYYQQLREEAAQEERLQHHLNTGTAQGRSSVPRFIVPTVPSSLSNRNRSVRFGSRSRRSQRSSPPPPPPPLASRRRDSNAAELRSFHQPSSRHQPRRNNNNDKSCHEVYHCKSSSIGKTVIMGDWKSAVDPSTGRTYYYNVATRETQWRKPMELASDDERREMEAKERKQKDFFASMEANILKSMAMGQPAMPTPTPLKRKSSVKMAEGDLRKLARPMMVRTISSMDESVLKDLVERVPSHHESRGSVMHRSNAQRNVLESVAEGTREDSFADQSSAQLDGMPAPQDADDGVASSPSRGLTRGESMALSDLIVITEQMKGLGETGDSSFSEGLDLNNPNPDVLMQEEFDFSRSLEMNLSASSALDVSGSSGGSPRAGEHLSKSSLDGLDISGDELDVVAEEPTAEKTPSMSNKAKESPSTDIPRPKPLGGAVSVTPPGGSKRIQGASKRKTKLEREMDKPDLSRRNTCGTLYVTSTMSAPDKDATIKCVCGVLRAHILASARDDAATMEGGYDPTSDRYRKFNDRDVDRNPSSENGAGPELSLKDLSLSPASSEHDKDDASDIADKGVPTLDEISKFYRDIFRRAQMETDCIIMSLIYVERLIKSTNGLLRPRKSNWRSLIFSAMILSSKVWDDLSMWNGDFSQACPAGVQFSLQRINELEVAVLTALRYKVKVPASEYAKYYFLLRSMLIKSGLSSESVTTATVADKASNSSEGLLRQKVMPLDLDGAKRLVGLSQSYQSVADTKRRIAKASALRSKSMGDADKARMAMAANGASVTLEHMMKL